MGKKGKDSKSSSSDSSSSDESDSSGDSQIEEATPDQQQDAVTPVGPQDFNM
jgi:hypothetical protein